MASNFGGTKSKVWPLCPEGPQQVVCVDIVDLGILPTDYGDKPKVRLVFQSAALDDSSGAPFQVSQQLTASLHEKATLSKVIEGWLGRKLTAEDREVGIAEEALIGANGFGNIVHNEGNNGRTYANLGSLMPLPRGIPKIDPINYIRVKDRPSREERKQDDL